MRNTGITQPKSRVGSMSDAADDAKEYPFQKQQGLLSEDSSPLTSNDNGPRDKDRVEKLHP